MVTMPEINEEELRFGISALALSNKDHAVNDELMTRASDGKMYYKREDGNIVSYESSEYDRDGIVTTIKNITNTSTAWSSPADDSIAYYIANMAGNNIITSESIVLDIPEIKASGHSNGVFIRLKPNANTSATIAFIDAYRRKENMMASFATLTYTVAIGSNPATEYTADVSIDKPVFIPFNNTVSTDATIKIKFVSINYSNLKSIVDSMQYETIQAAKAVNFMNAKIEVDRMDIITYIKDSSEIKIGVDPSTGFEFRYAFPVSIISDEYSVSDGIVISEDKPTYKCIWGKVLSRTV